MNLSVTDSRASKQKGPHLRKIAEGLGDISTIRDFYNTSKER